MDIIQITRSHRSQRGQIDPNVIAAMPPVPLPQEVYLESTNRCNELCDQCPRTHLKREEERDLTIEDTRMIVEQLPNLKRVVLHGLGEPLLNPALPEIVAYLRKRDIYVLFNSNATALSERMSRALIEAGLNELRVSLDGATPATYARVRGVNEKTLPRILRNVSHFTRIREEMKAVLPRISYWFTAMKENISELPLIADLARETGVQEIYVQRLIYFDKGLAQSEQALYRRTHEEELAIIATTAERCREYQLDFRATGAATPQAYLENISHENEHRPWSACQRPRKLAYITAIGNVYSCCFSPFHPGPAQERILGNVFQTPFAEIWNGERYQSFRAAFDSDSPWDQCAGCGSKWSL